jgi:hypothetical protein
MEKVRVITWRTTKKDGAFRWIVYSFAYREPIEILREGVEPSRCRARTQAQNWTRKLKRAPRHDLAAAPP